ncbi:MAG: bifunctional [glutamine synthetase] adenylyltransferase/[glutamine synthetase]-adenylyl-L-tyrosine phosphorylase [Paracoccaceae bacterium]
MNFIQRITRVPRPFDPERGADALKLVPDLPQELHDLFKGTAGCSPYLAELMQHEADWIVSAIADPEDALTQCLAINWRDAKLPITLRQAKRRVALLTALADLGGVWSLEDVTQALTQFADIAVDTALRSALLPLVNRGKLPGMTEDDVEGSCAVTVLAMGKMGAFELNYSSDVDLICLFDETRFEADDYATLRSGFSRAVRQMCTTLSDTKAGGYVFRTDLRLRPDPSVTPVVLSMSAAERYYESLGRTWERAAYIKARACAGDIEAGSAFLETLYPFVWRKHLDFAAIEDAHNMRLAIREHKGLGGPITLPKHNMKLGRGGIREIEFFTQTRQLIAGGRNPDLRVRGTVPALKQLTDADWIQDTQAAELSDHYRFHRTVEHRLQMVQDAQTHSLPGSDEGMTRLADMMDMDTRALKVELIDRLSAVHLETEGFFAPDHPDAAPLDEEEPKFDASILERWHGYPAMRSERAQAGFDRIRPHLIAGLQAAARPEEALAAFDGFLAGLPAGVQIFALFEANPQLVDLLLDVLTVAPPLAEHLSRNASVLDAVIGGDFFADWPAPVELQSNLATALHALDDYEEKLNTARRWAKEWHFRAGVHHLRGITTAEEAGEQYSDIADASLRALWPHVTAQFSKRHGPPPGRGAAIVGMGSIGSGRMTPASDLDLIVIYDPADATESTGDRPLAVRPYYARLTQALVTALSAQTAEGRLYEVDMRLRPSGSQGPVATSWNSFQTYQRNDAWLWEHLALTRARCLAGPVDLVRDIDDLLNEVLGQDRSVETVKTEVLAMRQRIADAKQSAGPFDAKTGRGRLQDVELFIQAAALLAGTHARNIRASAPITQAVGLTNEDGAATLASTYAQAWALQVAMRLVTRDPAQADSLGQGAKAMILRAAKATNMEDAASQFADAFDQAAAIIDAGLNSGRNKNGEG